ncbi:2951_t:CDS:1 [Cetraspora pellucida]|uniref:2951_t:CDS:1 n=1 Tax=Cetraspora pellucida TaxID=1433469 RepID=A0A9N9INB7_9GLOM|nr:2951_t:CDS:1 [Cetraspora pellucida]
MTAKVTSTIGVWARNFLLPKTTHNNSHFVEYHHTSFFSQSHSRFASTVSDQQGFQFGNAQAAPDDKQFNQACYQGVSPHPSFKVVTVIAGASAAFWFNHRDENLQWKQLLPQKVIDRAKCWSYEKSQKICKSFSWLSAMFDESCPRQTYMVGMMGMVPRNVKPGGREPLLTPPLTPDSSPPGSNDSFKSSHVSKGLENGCQSSSPLESAIFDFETFINRNVARAENITGLYYARHNQMNNVQAQNSTTHTPAHFFQLASEKFHPSAQFNLALCYHYGKGGVTYSNLPKAIEYYTLAASDGHKIAQYNLGVLYQKGGKGIEKDVGLSLGWLQKAAEGENGYLPAKLAIALLWQNGVEGIPKNNDRAKEILKLLIEESRHKIGNTEANANHSNHDPILELTSISSAALANYYLEKLSTNSQLPQHHQLSTSARYHWEYLSHPHSPAAIYNLGVLYEFHLNDVQLAVKCYKLAVQLANINKSFNNSQLPSSINQEDLQCVQNAMWNLGVIFAKGKGGLQKDFKEAKRWFNGINAKNQEMEKLEKWLDKKLKRVDV